MTFRSFFHPILSSVAYLSSSHKMIADLSCPLAFINDREQTLTILIWTPPQTVVRTLLITVANKQLVYISYWKFISMEIHASIEKCISRFRYRLLRQYYKNIVLVSQMIYLRSIGLETMKAQIQYCFNNLSIGIETIFINIFLLILWFIQWMNLWIQSESM